MPRIELLNGEALELQDNILEITKTLLQEARTKDITIGPEVKFCRAPKKARDGEHKGKYVVEVWFIPTISKGETQKKLGEIALDLPLMHSLYLNHSPEELDAIEERVEAEEDTAEPTPPPVLAAGAASPVRTKIDPRNLEEIHASTGVLDENATSRELDVLLENDEKEESSQAEVDPKFMVYVLEHKPEKKSDRKYIGGLSKRRDRYDANQELDSHVVKFAVPIGELNEIKTSKSITVTCEKLPLCIYKRTKKTGVFNSFSTYKGPDLFELSGRDKKLSAERANFLALRTLECIQREYTKKPDVFFNDLKPENLAYRGNKDKAYIIDRKALKNPATHTPEYLAPWIQKQVNDMQFWEVVKKFDIVKNSQSKARDLYALGQTLRDLARGQTAWEYCYLRQIGNKMKSVAEGMHSTKKDWTEQAIEWAINGLSINYSQLIDDMAENNNVTLLPHQKMAMEFFLKTKEFSPEKQTSNTLKKFEDQARESLKQYFFSDPAKSAMLTCALLGAKEYLEHPNNAKGHGRAAVFLLLPALAKIETTKSPDEYKTAINTAIQEHTTQEKSVEQQGYVIPKSRGYGAHSRKKVFKHYKIDDSVIEPQKINDKLVRMQLEKALISLELKSIWNIISGINNVDIKDNSLKKNIIIASLMYLYSDAGDTGKKAVREMIIDLVMQKVPLKEQESASEASAEVENGVVAEKSPEQTEKANEIAQVEMALQNCYKYKGCWAALFSTTGKRQAIIGKAFEEYNATVESYRT